MLLKNMISEVDSNSSVAHTHYAIFGISSFDIHIPAMSFNHVWSTCNVPVFFALVFALSIFGAVIPAYADSVAPTFSSTALDEETGILTITFDETIDVDTVIPTGLHIRESGSSSNSVTLSDVELTTSSDSTVISFTLTEDNRQTVIALTTPQLDIDESTVQDLVANTYDAPAFDVSTAFFVTSFSVADYDTSPQGLTFNSDGTKMFVIGNGGNTVYEYTLSTAFDISTATYDDVSFSVSSEVTIATDLTFNSDGTKMFVVDNGGDNVNEYTLSNTFSIGITSAILDSISNTISLDPTTTTITSSSAESTLNLSGLSDTGGSQTATFSSDLVIYTEFVDIFFPADVIASNLITTDEVIVISISTKTVDTSVVSGALFPNYEFLPNSVIVKNI